MGPACTAAQVATAVIELQNLLPNARVLYCSATGVSEVRLAYHPYYVPGPSWMKCSAQLVDHIEFCLRQVKNLG
jgi:hypothetical protein